MTQSDLVTWLVEQAVQAYGDRVLAHGDDLDAAGHGDTARSAVSVVSRRN